MPWVQACSRNRPVPVQASSSSAGMGASQWSMRAMVPARASTSRPSGRRTSVPCSSTTTPNSEPSAMQRLTMSR
ncbi:Uncharacterised protein [Bordetella pertussis]|nr:Uncharacterised protein [Bordetella pertussis]